MEKSVFYRRTEHFRSQVTNLHVQEGSLTGPSDVSSLPRPNTLQIPDLLDPNIISRTFWIPTYVTGRCYDVYDSSFECRRMLHEV